MADYISREAAADVLRKAIWDNTPFGPTMMDCLDKIVFDIPAADVQPVVYCKDCELWAATLSEEDRAEAAIRPYADCVCDLYDSDGFGPFDFCSNARRRLDDQGETG